MGPLESGDLTALTVTNIALGIAVCALCLYVVLAGVWEFSGKRSGKSRGFLPRDLRLIEPPDSADRTRETRAQAKL
jgi:hypothetical protein